MSSEKYIGLDVHQATISVAVVDSQGKVVMESILETKASTLLEFLAGLRGSLFVTFEEGTWAAWLYDLLKPHVTEVLVCNPRKIPLLKQGNKNTVCLPLAVPFLQSVSFLTVSFSGFTPATNPAFLASCSE
jgi:hypothetical protein